MSARFLTYGMNVSMMAARPIAPSASTSSQGLPEVANPQEDPKVPPGEGERAVRALTKQANRWRMLVNGRLWVERRNIPMVESFTVAPGDTLYRTVAWSTLKLMSAVLTTGPLPGTDGIHYNATSPVFAHDVPRLHELGRALSSRNVDMIGGIIASSSPGVYYSLHIAALSSMIGFVMNPTHGGKRISMYVFDGGRAFKPFIDSARLFARVAYRYGKGSFEIDLSQSILKQMNVGGGVESSEDELASFSGEVMGWE